MLITILTIIYVILSLGSLGWMFYKYKKANKQQMLLTAKVMEIMNAQTFSKETEFLNHLMDIYTKQRIFSTISSRPSVDIKGQKAFIKTEKMDNDTVLTVSEVLDTLSEQQMRKLLFFFSSKEKLTAYITKHIFSMFNISYSESNAKLARAYNGKLVENPTQQQKDQPTK
jgi:hypothetical protein